MSTAEVISELDAFSFDADEHIYRNALGFVRPSVTECMHAAGLYDFSRVDPMVFERKRRIGKSVHRATAEFDSNGWCDETWLEEDEIPYFRGWQLFRKDFHEIRFDKIEAPMLRTVHGVEIGGTPDRQGWIAGARLILDLKCAAADTPAWRIQTASYELMEFDSLRCGHAVRMVVLLRPDGTYRTIFHDKPEDAAAALGCIQLEAWKRNAGMR